MSQTSDGNEVTTGEMDKVTTRLRKGGLLSLFGCVSGRAALNYFYNESFVARSSLSYAQNRDLFSDEKTSFSYEMYSFECDEPLLFDLPSSFSEESLTWEEESPSLSSIDDEDEAYKQMAEIVDELVKRALEGVERNEGTKVSLLTSIGEWFKRMRA